NTPTGTRSATGLTRGNGQLVYEHGLIQDQPRIYLDFWGWADSQMDTGGYSAVQAENYIEAFVNGLAGSTYLQPQRQYCQGIAAGQTSAGCAASALHVGTLGALDLARTWTDTTAVLGNPPTDAQIAAEADAARVHFGIAANDVNATVIVLSRT